MNDQKANQETPAPIPISKITVNDPATGKTILSGGTGTVTYSAAPFFTPILTILECDPPPSGLIPAIPYTVFFKEGDYRMQIQLLTFVPLQPNPPYAAPYNFSWVASLAGGVPVTKVSVFDNILESYVIKDAAGTFYQAGGSGGYYFMTLMQVDTSSGSVVNGGPATFRNCSITYTETNAASGKDYQLTLSELLFQGQLSDTLYVFQQIGAGAPPQGAENVPSSKPGGEGQREDENAPSESQPDKE